MLSRPIHFDELCIILERFKIMLEDEPERYSIEEFIMQENFRRDLFKKL